MADEEKIPDEQKTPNEGSTPTGAGRTSELEGLLSSQTEELQGAKVRLAEMEKALIEANERTTRLDGSLKQAVTSYKVLILKANPDILPELLSGETITDLDSSVSQARDLIGKIKSGLESQAGETHIPAGAPQRGAADTSGLSAREKIREGINRK
jgi:hypothetical protein